LSDCAAAHERNRTAEHGPEAGQGCDNPRGHYDFIRPACQIEKRAIHIEKQPDAAPCVIVGGDAL
jgi:hypothetical protein